MALGFEGMGFFRLSPMPQAHLIHTALLPQAGQHRQPFLLTIA